MSQFCFFLGPFDDLVASVVDCGIVIDSVDAEVKDDTFDSFTAT